MVKLYENEVVTKHEFEMNNITNEVKKAVADSGIKNGMVAVITKHTTTGIMINEALPCVCSYKAALPHCRYHLQFLLLPKQCFYYCIYMVKNGRSCLFPTAR